MASDGEVIRHGRPLVAGEAHGRALVLEHGLSFAMAVDVQSGRITDVHGSHTGVPVSGRVLVMPGGRGSSSASTALAEAIRLGTAPAAIVLAEVDEILAVGAMVAHRLYGRLCPITLLAAADQASILDGDMVGVRADGTISTARLQGGSSPRMFTNESSSVGHPAGGDK